MIHWTWLIASAIVSGWLMFFLGVALCSSSNKDREDGE